MPRVPLAASVETISLLQLVPLGVLVALYAARARSLAKDGAPLARWRQICFYSGSASIAVALGALARVGQELLFPHTLGDLVFGDVAAALIVLGLTEPLLAPLNRFGAVDRLRVLSHPLPAFTLWVLDLYAWHLPALYQAALDHALLQALQHAMLLLCAINMWMCLLGPFPGPRWFGNGAKLLYIIAVRVAGVVLSNVILWSGTVLYPHYLTGEARFHVSPLADQGIAGAILLFEQALVALCLFYWLHSRVAGEGQLVKPSRARGLGDAPSARAPAGPGEPERHDRLQARTGAPERM